MKVSKVNFFLNNKCQVVITVCDLIEKFECAGNFTMCGNNGTRKYWLIADKPNKEKNVALFRPLSRFYGGGHGPPAPLFLHPWPKPRFPPRDICFFLNEKDPQ